MHFLSFEIGILHYNVEKKLYPTKIITETCPNLCSVLDFAMSSSFTTGKSSYHGLLWVYPAIAVSVWTAERLPQPLSTCKRFRRVVCFYYILLLEVCTCRTLSLLYRSSQIWPLIWSYIIEVLALLFFT